MSAYTDGGRAVRGVLRRRLLVNAVVDPDEAAARLPAGLRPHVTPSGTVIGCCLLEIVQLRPACAPARFGIGQLAVACRVSAEWIDTTGDTVVGVWVPARRTTSKLAVAAGGRWFPGVHTLADITVDTGGGQLSWRVDSDDAFRLDVTASAVGPVGEAVDVVGCTCLHAAIGVSADRHGQLEAARMQPAHRTAQPVDVEHLDSAFIAGFATARPAPSYLMEHVPVDWTPAPPPTTVRVAA